MADRPHACQLLLGTPSSPSTSGSMGPLPSPSLQRLSSSGSPAFKCTTGGWVWALGLGALRGANSALLLFSGGAQTGYFTSQNLISGQQLPQGTRLKTARVQTWRLSAASRTESTRCRQAARITAALTRCLILVFFPARLTYACQDSLPSRFQKLTITGCQELSLHTPSNPGPLSLTSHYVRCCSGFWAFGAAVCRWVEWF